MNFKMNKLNLKFNQRTIIILFLFLLCISITYSKVNMTLFYQNGCPHCAALESYLNELNKQYDFNLTKYEITDLNNRKLFIDSLKRFDMTPEGVPTLIINNKVLVGNSKENRDIILNILKESKTSLKNKGSKNNVSYTKINLALDSNKQNILKQDKNINKENKDKLDSLTITTLIGAALVDSINPCTLAVLLILLTSLISKKRRKAVLLSGTLFSLAIFISYFLMGLGVYKALTTTGLTRLFYYIIIPLAFIIAFFSIKDYFNYKPGLLAIEIPMRWRPILKKLISKVNSPWFAGLIGFLCSLFLLPCSSGPYLFILGLLADKSTYFTAVFLLLFYNLIFIMPMIIITLLIYFGLSDVKKVHKFREKNIKLIHLISGIIMFILAMILLIQMITGNI